MAKAQWRSDPNCPPEDEIKSKEWYKRLALNTEKQLTSVLKSENGRGAIAVAENIHTRTEQINNSTFSKLVELRQAGRDLPEIACQRGCNYCCHLEVGCFAPESIRIADHLRKTRDPKQLAALVAKMRRHVKRKSTMTLAQRESTNVGPCPFLGATGECTIYPVRPTCCRTYHTFSLKDCVRAHSNPERKFRVLMVNEPFDTRDAMFEALEKSCEKLDLPSEQLELIRSVLVALKVPNAAALWRQGTDVFAEARL